VAIRLEKQAHDHRLVTLLLFHFRVCYGAWMCYLRT